MPMHFHSIAQEVDDNFIRTLWEHAVPPNNFIPLRILWPQERIEAEDAEFTIISTSINHTTNA